MIRNDRVFCDMCHCHVGQLFNHRCDPSALPDLKSAPNFVICPDCYGTSEAELLLDCLDYV